MAPETPRTIEDIQALRGEWPHLSSMANPMLAVAIVEWAKSRLASALSVQKNPKGVRVEFINGHAVPRYYP